MKAIILLLTLSATSTLFAKDFKNCVVVNGPKEIEAFDILNVDTKEPEADIDGSLVDYSETKTEITMNFSNQCDNNYFVTFKKSELKKKSGKVQGHAEIEVYGYSDDGEPTVAKGTLTCEISL